MKNQLFISFYFIFNIFIIIRGNDHDNKYVTYETPQGKEFFLRNATKVRLWLQQCFGVLHTFFFCDFLLLFQLIFLYVFTFCT